jgi:hypothetical protein
VLCLQDQFTRSAPATEILVRAARIGEAVRALDANVHRPLSDPAEELVRAAEQLVPRSDVVADGRAREIATTALLQHCLLYHLTLPTN